MAFTDEELDSMSPQLAKAYRMTLETPAPMIETAPEIVPMQGIGSVTPEQMVAANRRARSAGLPETPVPLSKAEEWNQYFGATPGTPGYHTEPKAALPSAQAEAPLTPQQVAPEASPPEEQTPGRAPGWQDLTRDVRSTSKNLSPEYFKQLKQSQDSFNRVIDLHTEAAQEENQILGTQAKADLVQAQADQQEQARLDQQAEARYNSAYTSQMQAADDVRASKIDPNHYWAERGTANQIGSALAIGLGAFGAAMNHGPNYAMQIIDNAINRDMMGQEAEMKKKTSLFEMAREGLQGARQLSTDEQARFNSKKIAALEVSKKMLDSQMVGVRDKRTLEAGEQMRSQFSLAQAKLASETASTSTSHSHQVFDAGAPPGGKALPQMSPDDKAKFVPGANAFASTPKEATELREMGRSSDELSGIAEKMAKIRKESPVDVANPYTQAHRDMKSLLNQGITMAMKNAGVKSTSKSSIQHWTEEFGDPFSLNPGATKTILDFAHSRSEFTRKAYQNASLSAAPQAAQKVNPYQGSFRTPKREEYSSPSDQEDDE